MPSREKPISFLDRQGGATARDDAIGRPGEDSSLVRFGTPILTALVVALVARQFWFALRGYLNVDEFENLQMLWLWAHGVLPVRDYEHTHLPVYNLLLAPIYRAVGPVAGLPGVVRIALFPIVLLTVAQVAWLGRRLVGLSPGGRIAAALLLASPWTAVTLAEMRPDTPAIPLALGALMLHLGYLEDPAARPRRLYGAAVLLGLSLLFSQKPILLALAMAWEAERAHARRFGMAFVSRAVRMAGFTLLLALPFAATVALLRFSLNLSGTDLGLLLTSGMAREVTDFHRATKPVVLAALIGPNALFALLALVEAVRSRFWTGGKDPDESGRKIAGAFVVFSAVQLLALPFVVGQVIALPLAVGAALAACALARLQPRTWILGVFLVVAFANLAKPYGYPTRGAQVEAFRFLLDRVAPDRPILDVQTGLGAFHPFVERHLYYRPGLYDERINAEQTALVARGLDAKTFGAVVDHFGLMAQAPAEIRSLLAKNYRRGPWEDVLLPVEHPPALGGRGG